MSGHTPIRIASAAALLSLAILAWTEFATAQNASVASPQASSQLSIPLVAPHDMVSEDQAIAKSWQPAIASSAQFFGYTVDSSYSYREIACPAAPHRLLLAYESTAPNGSISRFTAVVRRGAKEEFAARHPAAQIIPILHFGVVPFIPAIANPHSIEVFNAAMAPVPSATEILAADQAGKQPLLVRGLCYLAMVGEEPAALTPPPSSPATILAPAPTLVFQNKGRIHQLISIRNTQDAYQVWALTFQSGGNLLTATRQEHPIDRTPLVLNATNGGSPPPLTSSPAPASVVAAPAPASPTLPPAPMAGPPATPAPAAEAVAAPVSPAPPANPPAVVATTPPPAAPAPAPIPSEPAAAIATPPAAPPAPPSVANPAPPAPALASFATPPVVKLSPPLPPGRFIPNPPRPPSRIIPDSALKTPPHLSQ